MKVVAQTKDNTILMLDKGECVHSHRPSVVSWSEYVQAREISGQVKVLVRDLPDTASDNKFQKHFSDANQDTDKALAAFKSDYEMDEDEREDKAKKSLAETNSSNDTVTPKAKK